MSSIQVCKLLFAKFCKNTPILWFISSRMSLKWAPYVKHTPRYGHLCKRNYGDPSGKIRKKKYENESLFPSLKIIIVTLGIGTEFESINGSPRQSQLQLCWYSAQWLPFSASADPRPLSNAVCPRRSMDSCKLSSPNVSHNSMMISIFVFFKQTQNSIARRCSINAFHIFLVLMAPWCNTFFHQAHSLRIFFNSTRSWHLSSSYLCT